MAALELNSTPLISDANLQFYLRFESNWNDTTANAYNLSPTNSPTFVTGQFGYGGNFVATSTQKATRAIASMTNTIITTTQSWMMWVKFSTLTDNNYILGTSNGGHNFLYGGSGGQITWATGLSTTFGVGGAVAGQWCHVAFAYNSSTAKISSWFNGGIVQNQVSVTGSWTNSGSTFGLGNIGDYAGYGTFSIDELCMFNKEITNNEVLTYFNGVSTNYLKQYRRTRFPGAITGV